MTIAELVQAFTRMSGREVRYQQVPWDEFESQAGREYTTMYRWFDEVGYHVDISALSQDYPRMTSFEKWLQANATSCAAPAGSNRLPAPTQ